MYTYVVTKRTYLIQITINYLFDLFCHIRINLKDLRFHYSNIISVIYEYLVSFLSLTLMIFFLYYLYVKLIEPDKPQNYRLKKIHFRHAIETFINHLSLTCKKVTHFNHLIFLVYIV